MALTSASWPLALASGHFGLIDYSCIHLCTACWSSLYLYTPTPSTRMAGSVGKWRDTFVYIETSSPWAVKLSWLENACSCPLFSGRGRYFGVPLGLISRFVHLQDFKYLCAAVMISATLLNIQTHTQTAVSLAYMNSE